MQNEKILSWTFWINSLILIGKTVTNSAVLAYFIMFAALFVL
jgi:hypothetical protein